MTYLKNNIGALIWLLIITFINCAYVYNYGFDLHYFLICLPITVLGSCLIIFDALKK